MSTTTTPVSTENIDQLIKTLDDVTKEAALIEKDAAAKPATFLKACGESLRAAVAMFVNVDDVDVVD